jgi:hypothetical protein
MGADEKERKIIFGKPAAERNGNYAKDLAWRDVRQYLCCGISQMSALKVVKKQAGLKAGSLTEV